MHPCQSLEARDDHQVEVHEAVENMEYEVVVALGLC